MHRYHSAESTDKNEINLTPMLDVVFILLIFFVVTASFIKDYGIQIALPLGLKPSNEAVETITVTVEAGGSFWVNGRPLAKGSLAPYIRHLRSEFPEAGFAVLVSDDSLVDDTVTAADAGRQAGFGRVPVGRLE